MMEKCSDRINSEVFNLIKIIIPKSSIKTLCAYEADPYSAAYAHRRTHDKE